MAERKTGAKFAGPFTHGGWSYYEAYVWDDRYYTWRVWFTQEATPKGRMMVARKVREYNAEAQAQRGMVVR